MKIIKVHSAGFTLIELLVVISIIAMLSSVILASVQGARDKGRVAGGLRFSSYNDHAFSTDAIALYNFDESSGDAKDGSVNSRDLLQSESAFSRANTNPATLNGRGNYLSLVINGSAGRTGALADSKRTKLSNSTMSFWVYYTQMSAVGKYVASVMTDDGVTFVWGENLAVKISGTNRLSCVSDLLQTSALLSTVFAPNKWYHIACSVNTTSGRLAGYVDGSLVGSATGVVNASMLGNRFTSITVGADDPNGDYGNDGAITGAIDDFALYSQALSALDIQKVYLAGLPTHPVALK